ncbi:MAG: hypothetical protein ACXWT4_11735 [Methylobacter sp.]
MAVPNANYVFLPWVRQGAASGITTPDSLGANQAGAVSVTVKLRINDDPDDIDRQVRLYGPGDIAGIDSQQVVRTEPRHLAMDFEPNYFPAIEFDRPDFPWLFTPAKANDAGKLRPWLCLVVVRKQEGITLHFDRNLPLPVLEINAPARPERELPDLSESWAWAHTQVTGSRRDAASLQASLTGDPALTVSRVLCPRRLDPLKDYLACVVPALELGRKAGLGEPISPVDEQKLTPAWVSGATPVTLPVYFHWEFRTGAGGDFEALVRLLEPRKMPEEAGKQRIDISQPGFSITSGTMLELEGALRVPDAQIADWPEETRTPFQTGLKTILDAPWQAVKEGAEPLLAPPVYGCWQAARHTVNLPPVPPVPQPWLDELNLDPRHRAVAALGTKVVQTQQEQLMASAWEQLGEIERINQMRRQAQLGRAVNKVYHAKSFSRFPEEVFFKVVAPAQSRVVLTEQSPAATPIKTLLVQKIAGSSIPSNVVSAPIRRILRPRGPINRQYLRAGATGVGDMFKVFNVATSMRIDPSARDKGAVTIDKVSESAHFMIQNANGFIWNPEPVGHWERVSAIFARMIELFRLSNLSGSALSSRQPAPPTLPGFYEAAIAHHNYLSLAFRLILVFEHRWTISTVDVRNALASLDPDKTLSARVQASLIITGGAEPRGDTLEPILDAPDFPQPMYEALRDLSQDFLFPGLEHVPPNTVTLLETNPKFVESFLVGLNAEMSSELLWRNYPTDQRGTYFRQFWDTSAGSALSDIKPVNSWGDRELGQNAGAGEQLVLLLRGELLRRYPNSVVYAVKADLKGGQFKLSEPAVESYPLFRGTMKPDVTFLGFDLTREEVIGKEDDSADAGWFFVIQEQPTEPRFGLDAADFGNPLPPLTTWNNLSWRHLIKNEDELKALSHASIKISLPDIDKAKWGLNSNSAHYAYITLQRPVRIAIHARDMILQEPEAAHAHA